jgi:hypothetical protein
MVLSKRKFIVVRAEIWWLSVIAVAFSRKLFCGMTKILSVNVLAGSELLTKVCPKSSFVRRENK